MTVVPRLRPLALLGALAFVACESPLTEEAVANELRNLTTPPDANAVQVVRRGFNPRLLRRFLPVRSEIGKDDAPISEAQVELGRMLFHEKRLSRDHELSCSSCHQLDKYGVDGAKASTGFKGQMGDRNAPTVYNAAGHSVQYWDGRSPNVEEQALEPLLNPVEMAAPSEAYVVSVLQSIPEYRDAMKRAFPDDPNPMSFENVGRAIGAFERRLVTPARWDQYLNGDKGALTAAEVDGLKTFTNVGCMVCHTGEFVGGSMFQKVGVVEPWPNQEDQGRFDVSQDDRDRMVFKVPSLRNVTETGPYFHDGSAATLDEAVSMMGKHQLGLELDKKEISYIVAWLGSLKGELPQAYVKAPQLPPSTAATPGPDKS